MLCLEGFGIAVFINVFTLFHPPCVKTGISAGDELFSMESLFSSVGRVGVAILGTKAAWVLGGCVQLSCQVSSARPIAVTVSSLFIIFYFLIRVTLLFIWVSKVIILFIFQVENRYYFFLNHLYLYGALIIFFMGQCKNLRGKFINCYLCLQIHSLWN